MFKFLLRKSFFDRWDHFFKMVLFNLFCFAVVSLYLLLASKIAETHFNILVLVGAFYCLLFSFFSIGMSGVSCVWSRFDTCNLKHFFTTIKTHFGHVFFLFGLRVFDVVSIFIIVPFYISVGTMWSLVLAFMLVFFVTFISLCQLIFSPLSILLEEKPLKCFNKCLAYVFDNFGFCILFGLKTVFDFVISVLTMLLIPGFAGISISKAAAARILLAKYVSSEDEMLKEEKEKVGERTIKDTFFPGWKKLK